MTRRDEQEDIARNLATIAAGVLPADLGFVLLVFPRGGRALGPYFSDVDREEAVRKLRLAAELVERQTDRHAGGANGAARIIQP